MNNRGSVPWSPVSGFGCGRAYRTSVAAGNKSAARAMGRKWQGPFSERSVRRAGTFFPKGPGDGQGPFSERSARMRGECRVVPAFHSHLIRKTLRKSVPARDASARQAGTFFRKVRANAWRMQGRCGFSFSPHSQDASEKRPCLRRRFGKASLPKKTLRKSVPDPPYDFPEVNGFSSGLKGAADWTVCSPELSDGFRAYSS